MRSFSKDKPLSAPPLAKAAILLYSFCLRVVFQAQPQLLSARSARWNSRSTWWNQAVDCLFSTIIIVNKKKLVRFAQKGG
jgi:hypothetical protein